MVSAAIVPFFIGLPLPVPDAAPARLAIDSRILFELGVTKRTSFANPLGTYEERAGIASERMYLVTLHTVHSELDIVYRKLMKSGRLKRR